MLPALPLVVLASLAPAPLVLLPVLGEDVLDPDRLLDEPLVVFEAPDEASDGVVVLDAPPVAPLDVPDIPLDVPDVPDVPLAPPEVPLAPPDVPLAPPDVPLAPLEDGRLRSTSPPEVPVVVPPVDALPVDGTQFVAEAPVFAVVPDVVLMPLVLDPLVLPAAPAPALIPLPVLPLAEPLDERAVVSVPVPFAPFVVFSPVNRWSGLVAEVLPPAVVPPAPVPLAPVLAPAPAPVVDPVVAPALAPMVVDEE